MKLKSLILCLLVMVILASLGSTHTEANNEDQLIQELEQSLPSNMNPIERQAIIDQVSESYTTNPPSTLTLDSRTLGIAGVAISGTLAGVAFYLKKKQG